MRYGFKQTGEQLKTLSYRAEYLNDPERRLDQLKDVLRQSLQTTNEDVATRIIAFLAMKTNIWNEWIALQTNVLNNIQTKLNTTPMTDAKMRMILRECCGDHRSRFRKCLFDWVKEFRL